MQAGTMMRASYNAVLGSESFLANVTGTYNVAIGLSARMYPPTD